jgi:hypothetical protein
MRCVKQRYFSAAANPSYVRIEMIPDKVKVLSSTYSAWFGKPVVLLIAFRQCHVPLPCSIVSESVADVRIRIKLGREMNVRKDLILAVEEMILAAEEPTTPSENRLN